MENFDENKYELIRSISDLFLQYGLRSTSMDDIANHLKISKKTLYQHFSNKDDVVEQVMLFRQKERIINSDLEHFRGMSAMEVLFDIKKFVVTDIAARLPANYFDMRKYHPTVYEKISKNEHEFTVKFFGTLIDEGIKKGYFRKNVEKDLQIYLLGRQLHFLRDPQMAKNISYPIPVVISQIIDNFALSLSTDKGRMVFEELQKKYDENKGNNQQNTT